MSTTAIVDIASAIARLGGSHAFYETLVEMFRKDGVGQRAALAQGIAQADYTNALRHAHTLKGLAATVGANLLAAAAARTEVLLKRQIDAGAAGADLALLNDSLAQLDDQLSLALQTLPQLVQAQ